MLRLSRTLALVLFALLARTSLGQASDAHPHRLYLKDGSYQLVTQYEVKGERVRYFSSERDEWEELPKALVDWPATEKWQEDSAAAENSPEAAKLDKEIDSDRELAAAKLPEVSPGLHLPDESGVFLLDTFHTEPQLVELAQTAGDVNQSTRANILRGAIPGAGVKATIELAGAHASIQSHVAVPSIYLNVDKPVPGSFDQPGVVVDQTRPADTRQQPQQPQQPQKPQQPQQPSVPFDRYRIVRADVKNDKRIIGDVKRQQVTGKVSEQQHAVKTTLSQLTGGWLKLTPTEPLAPGEYAIIEVVDKQMNLYVWDFGVNPNAPGNPNPYKPEPKPASAPQTKPDAKQP